MATGVKPRDEESQLTRADLELIQDALKQKQFRDLLVDYCEEIRDPANQAIYQEEMTQLEKERGYDVTFINPKGGYVIKTSVAGDRKAFINICSNENVAKPSCNVQVVEGRKGMNWQIPYSLIPPREDYNSKRERCVIYDVVYHPDTLRMASQNSTFRDLVNNTAINALKNNYNIHLDSNNCKFIKSEYKGMATPAVIRKEDPNFKPPSEEDLQQLSPDVIEKLYPQHVYSDQTNKDSSLKSDNDSEPAPTKTTLNQQRKSRMKKEEFSHSTENGYTIPKYIIKQQKNVDMQDFTFDKDCKLDSAIPSQIVVEINLPLLSSTKNCTLDVQEKRLHLVSEKPAKYKLTLTLPYSVNDQYGIAKFDKSRHMLIVTLPVIKKKITNDNYLRVDSGVESEENLSSQSDDDKDKLIEEIPIENIENVSVKTDEPIELQETFLNPTLSYLLPSYTHNVLDDTVAFTFHVKNTDPDSVKLKQDANKIHIKFTTIGSGFVPVHYAAVVVFENGNEFHNVSGEAWDNNVILQLEMIGDIPQKFQIGLTEDSLITENFEVMTAIPKVKPEDITPVANEEPSPTIEVTNLGSETSIVVSTNNMEDEEDEDDESPLPTSPIEKEIVWTETHSHSNAKSILRRPMARSFSESSIGDVASSMDYISSDCIPEESSLKKTVRFSDVIARQFYRYNSSIEGQKKKNQRKKSKKRTQERRKSESEAEDENINDTLKATKSKSKAITKERRDSGLADTSDAEADNKNTPDSESSYDTNKSMLNIISNQTTTEPVLWESDTNNSEKLNTKKEARKPVTTCSNIKHNTDLYNPDRLNKGQYTEVKFKNDLIFDLDM